jgi:hypothetical protein
VPQIRRAGSPKIKRTSPFLKMPRWINALVARRLRNHLRHQGRLAAVDVACDAI